MADAATLSSSEAVRDRASDEPEAPKPEAPRTAFGDVADRLARTQSDYLGVRAKQRTTLEENARETAPLIAGAEQAIATRPTVAPPAPPIAAPPPSRKLTDFLAPVQGEQPEQSVAKMIQSLGLMTMGFGIGGKRDARAALASLSGAMKGWQEGDKERADRAFADWQANTSSALKQWEAERKTYTDILAAGDLAIEDKLRLVKLAKLKHENKAMPEAHDAETLEKVHGWLEKEETQARQYELGVTRLEDMRLAREDANRYKEMKLEIEQMKATAAMKQVTDAVSALGPDELKALGQQWALGKLPPGIARGRAGQTIMPKIIKAGTEWAKENNINLAELPTIQAEMEGARKAIAVNQPKATFSRQQVGTFERHIAQLLELSDKVDRTQRPVVNRYLLKLRGQYEGDAQVAAYEALADEVGNEFAKVMVGTAQGDANTRASARDKINGALNPTQLRTVAEELKKAAHNRMAEWDAAIKYNADLISTVGNRTEAPPSNQPKGEKAPPQDAALSLIRRANEMAKSKYGKAYGDLDEPTRRKIFEEVKGDGG